MSRPCSLFVYRATTDPTHAASSAVSPPAQRASPRHQSRHTTRPGSAHSLTSTRISRTSTRLTTPTIPTRMTTRRIPPRAGGMLVVQLFPSRVSSLLWGTWRPKRLFSAARHRRTGPMRRSKPRTTARMLRRIHPMCRRSCRARHTRCSCQAGRTHPLGHTGRHPRWDKRKPLRG